MRFADEVSESGKEAFLEALECSISTYKEFLSDKVIYEIEYKILGNVSFDVRGEGEDRKQYASLVICPERKGLEIVTQYWAQDQILMKFTVEELEDIAENIEVVKNFIKVL